MAKPIPAEEATVEAAKDTDASAGTSAERSEERRKDRKEAFTFTPSPALWKISDSNSTVYIFGAIRGIPQPLEWQSEAFNNALQSADKVYFETPHIDRSQRILRRQYEREILHKLIRHDRDRVEERFDSNLYHQIKGDLMGAITIGDFMPTWLILAEVSGSDRILQPRQSNRYLDFRIAKTVIDHDLTIDGLEDPFHLIDILNKVSEKEQRQWLNAFIKAELAVDKTQRYKVLKRLPRDKIDGLSAKETQGILWAKGLPPEATPVKPAGLSNLFQKIHLDRMKNWPIKIDAMLDKPGTSLVIVNQEYLYGENNLRTALQAKGYKLDLLE
ncbi:TraB/GumN family protein [Parasphingorhabdus sp.]|uniref:TraB/GumN family protein n=1 Tax=Parasphingorhabdus sp. TaxID=2709688 RepID=UPI0032642225